jgi:8-oxo-dGTP pyrophosphatase MutT (NUDIX family)
MKPYRLNCEGYFIQVDKVLACKRGSYIEFPGGGVDDETAKQAIIRETFEETGAVVTNIKLLGKIHFDWNEECITSDKQRARFKQFRGEEMHFFTGDIKEIKETREWETIWLPLNKVIEDLKTRPGIKEYRQKQLEFLRLMQSTS